MLWEPQVAASSHTGCPSQPVLGERDKGLRDQLGAECYREELYLGRKRSGPEDGRERRQVRSHGALRAVPAVAARSPSLLEPRIQLPCPSCLEPSSPTAPFNCRSHHTCEGNPGGPTFPLPTLKGTAPSQDGPGAGSRSFGDSPSSCHGLTQPACHIITLYKRRNSSPSWSSLQPGDQRTEGFS